MNEEGVSIQEAERFEEEAKINDEFMEMMGDTIGHIQPDGTIKYSKMGWIG